MVNLPKFIAVIQLGYIVKYTTLLSIAVNFELFAENFY